MNIVSIRKSPKYVDRAIQYFQSTWKSILPEIYQDCITNCIDAKQALPQWYLLINNDSIIGCAGLITNDFISRMDLYPWVCAVYIDEKYRGNNYASLLIDQAKADTTEAGFDHLYIATDHIGYYEKFGFNYIGIGYHPWKEESRIYELGLAPS